VNSQDLALEHLGLVGTAARRTKPWTVFDRDDAWSEGVIGLLEAAERWDPDRGVTFATFAMQRIRGAVVDAQRQIDLLPRSVRDRTRLVGQASEALRQRLGRAPTLDELAMELGQSVASVHRHGRIAAEMDVVSLDAPVRGTDEPRSLADTISRSDEDPSANICAEASRDELYRAISLLAQRERELLGLHYYEQLTLGAIGARWGVTESRVCQIKTTALRRLRGLLLDRGITGAPDS
jgi:RNA polymerase sigma factor for flagellar operon FliA